MRLTQTGDPTEHTQMKLNQHCLLCIGATLYVLEKHDLYQI
jgi:hypothetical protein